MTTITTTNIPPEITQFFDSTLLSYPCPKFYDDSETLWKIYKYIKYRLMPKAKKNPLWMAKLERMEQEFLELYGRTKAKEVEYEEKEGKPFGQSFYCFRDVNKYHKGVLGRLTIRSIMATFFDRELRKDDPLPEINWIE